MSLPHPKVLVCINDHTTLVWMLQLLLWHYYEEKPEDHRHQNRNKIAKCDNIVRVLQPNEPELGIHFTSVNKLPFLRNEN